MNILAISDTHNTPLKSIVKDQKANGLIIAGDFLLSGTVQEWYKFKRYLKEVRHQFDWVCVGGGNHDIFVERNINLCKLELENIDVKLLIDEKIVIDGLNYYFSPWIPFINNRWAWEFNEHDYTQIEHTWSKIPSDTEILITHTPPAGILASCYGDEWLRNEILERVKPKIHLYGHVHEEGGRSFWMNGIRFYNVACLNLQYSQANFGTHIEV